MSSELQRFVHDALGRGHPREAIRAELRAAGWPADEIEAALGAWAESKFQMPVPRRRPSLGARETFLYLVLFATLYTSAINTGQVLFALIERWLPDPLRGADAWRMHGEWVRGATAGIIIAFPVFLFVSRLIGRELAREPGKRGSPIRKWLTYLTLFIAALVIIGALTVLVTRMLAGETAPRFLLKVLAVLLIAGTAFGHYLGDLRREEQAEAGSPRAGSGPLARVAAATVLAVVLAGLMLSGTPRAERARQLDARRIEALQGISSAVQRYYDRRGRLPESLDLLLGMPDGVAAETLRDPSGTRGYEYRTLDSLVYELCAEFETDAAEHRSGQPIAEFWRRGPGRSCFRLEAAERKH